MGTRAELEARIDALSADIVANEEENYLLENEIEELEAQISALPPEPVVPATKVKRVKAKKC